MAANNISVPFGNSVILSSHVQVEKSEYSVVSYTF